jgi:hypothetical protein
MGLLRKLFCKEEPQKAPESAPEQEAELPVYEPYGPYTYRRECHCVVCGKAEMIDGYNPPRRDMWVGAVYRKAAGQLPARRFYELPARWRRPKA